MYTQCPHCHEAFRVTAEILQQAAGRVRCGACGHAFDALDGLSEAPPSRGQEGRTPDEDAALRATLEELSAADNVRIEDTGVEWRVVEDDDPGEPAESDDTLGSSALRWYIHEEPADSPNDALIPEARAAEDSGLAPPELETPTVAEERYDDNTPLPGLLDADEEEEVPPAFPETPRRRAEDFIEPRSSEFDERQADLALGDPEEWTDLLEEVAGTEEAALDATGSDDADADDEPTAEHPVIEEPVTPGTGAQPAARAERELTRVGGADLTELRLVDEREREPDARTPAPAPAPDPAGEQLALEAQPDEATGEFVELSAPVAEDAGEIERLIDEDLLRASGAGHALSESGARAEPPPHVETIVMEGERVQSSLHGELVVPPAGEEAVEASPAEAAPATAARHRSLRDTYLRLREALPPLPDAGARRRWPALAASFLLGLLLAAQLVHAHRERLATWPSFQRTVGALYARLGAPITPDWDINGWQFEGTSGATDASDRILTISTSITNRSPRALPYPLLHVALTDRYEEIVAGGLLDPAQYLEIRSAEGMVDAGENFTATITIAPLAEEAEGYKLNVCYPLERSTVRCATGAFRHN